MSDPSSAPVQGYSRFINMVRLSVKVGSVYEIAEGNESPAGAIQHNDKIYALVPPVGGEAQSVVPEISLVRRLIEIGLREKLRAAGCSFKPGADYVAY
ncbi:MAG: hypothetical protein ACR2MF_03835, partial [Chthoniobacterales bacterium]